MRHSCHTLSIVLLGLIAILARIVSRALLNVIALIPLFGLVVRVNYFFFYNIVCCVVLVYYFHDLTYSCSRSSVLTVGYQYVNFLIYHLVMPQFGAFICLGLSRLDGSIIGR